MIFSGYFSYNNPVYKSKNLSYEKDFTFINGIIYVSDSNSLQKDILLNIFVKSYKTNFYQLLYGSPESREYNYDSNSELINSFEFKEILESHNSINIIIDEQSGDISLVRDIFGTAPLFYSYEGQGFIFSSDIHFIRNHKEFKGKNEVNVNRVINYLTWMSDGLAYTSDTFYKNINSVLPGHQVNITNAGITTKPIIAFSPDKWDQIQSLEEYGYIFREIFRKSVADCIENETVIASHLSGGMDSSSVSSMIREVNPHAILHTLYADTKTSLTDEMYYANKVSEKIKSITSIVDPSQNELDLLINNTALYNFPEHMAISPSLQTSLIRITKTLGSNILLTGTDGDSIVGHGYDYVEDLFYKQQWDELKNALSNWAQTRSGISTRKNWDQLSVEDKKKTVFRDFFYQKIMQSHSISNALSLIDIAKRKFSISYSELFIKGIAGFKNRIQYLNRFPESILSSNLSNNKLTDPKHSLPDILRGSLPDKYSFTFKDVFYNQAMVTNEEIFYLGRANGVYIKYPFYNKALFELCMAIPSIIKYNNGTGRGHFREAMKGILVNEVRTRTDKGIFSSYGREAALRLYAQSGDFLTETNKVWEYVDKSSFRKSIKLLKSENQPPYIYNRTLFFVNRTIFLSIWLNTSLSQSTQDL